MYKSYEDFCVNDPQTAGRYRNVIKDYYSYAIKATPYTKAQLWWIWGPTGTGKSALAAYLQGNNRFRKTGDYDWFDGYMG